MDTFVVLVFPDRIEATMLGGDKQIGFQRRLNYKIFPVSPKEKALTPAQALQNHHQKYIGMHIRKGGSNT